MDTVKIDLFDSDFAEIYKELLHKTSRDVQNYYKQFMRPVGKPVLLSDVVEGKEKIINDYQIDKLSIDDDKVLDIYISHQVKEWSFGKLEVKSLENVSEKKVSKLKEEMNRLYTPSPLAENGQKASSSQ